MAKSTSVSITAFVAVLVAAFVLNPSPEHHRAKIRETVGERNQIAGALGLGALAAFASTYHSLGIASYTTAGDRTLSWGAFGMVFVAQ